MPLTALQAPTCWRYWHLSDLDFFHAATDAANQSFVADATTLRAASAWRFLPLVEVEGGGLTLHPIDVAIDKLVALANRREPRDLVDPIFADTHILPFPALVWAVVEKNPELNPAIYLEQFRRHTLTQEDAAYLRFTGAYRVEDAAQHARAHTPAHARRRATH